MSDAHDNQWSHTRAVTIEKQYDGFTVTIRANRHKWGYKVVFADGREIAS